MDPNANSDYAARFGAWAVIAGGSDGIGAAFAREAAARGLDVAVLARRLKPMRRLVDEIREEHGVDARAFPVDLTDRDALEGFMAASTDLDVGLLVCNAGSSLAAAPFLDRSAADAEFVVDLSVRAPTLLAHHFGTRFRARGRGGIVLMSSLAGLAGSGYQAAYAASKAFDTTLAEGLWWELAPHGVAVLGVLAGATRTETMLAQNEAAFDDAMDPREVATGALDHLGKGPNWVPGAANQQAARGLWPLPRVGVVNAMSQASGGMFELDAPAIDGLEFDASAGHSIWASNASRSPGATGGPPPRGAA